MKSSVLHEFKNVVLIIVGIFLEGMGLKGFLESSHFIDGGATGVSMLFSACLGCRCRS